VSRRARTFRRLSPAVSLATILLWILAVTLVWVGLVGDDRGWWSNRPFLTNLISSLTGASFGIPIALIFIGLLSQRQREFEIDRRISDLAHAAASARTKHFRCRQQSLS
jgi:hypothetical protein